MISELYQLYTSTKMAVTEGRAEARAAAEAARRSGDAATGSAGQVKGLARGIGVCARGKQGSNLSSHPN